MFRQMQRECKYMCIYDCIIFFKNQDSKHLNIGLFFPLLYKLWVSESKVLQDQAYEFVGLYYFTSEFQLFQSTCLWNVHQHTILFNDPTGVPEYSQGKIAATVTAAEAGHTLSSRTVLHQHSAALRPPPARLWLKENEPADLLSCTTRKLDKKMYTYSWNKALCCTFITWRGKSQVSALLGRVAVFHKWTVLNL